MSMLLWLLAVLLPSNSLAKELNSRVVEDLKNVEETVVKCTSPATPECHRDGTVNKDAYPEQTAPRRVKPSNKPIDTKIKGGVSVQPEAAKNPSVLILFYKDGELDHSCSGVMLSEQTVLSAGHCFENSSEIDKIVIMRGLKDVTIEKKDLSLVPHPKYNSKTGEHDLGVIHLPAAFKGPVAIIAEEAPKNHDTLLLFGYGEKEKDQQTTNLYLNRSLNSVVVGDSGLKVNQNGKEEIVSPKKHHGEDAILSIQVDEPGRGDGWVMSGDSGGGAFTIQNKDGLYQLQAIIGGAVESNKYGILRDVRHPLNLEFIKTELKKDQK